MYCINISVFGWEMTAVCGWEWTVGRGDEPRMKVRSIKLIKLNGYNCIWMRNETGMWMRMDRGEAGWTTDEGSEDGFVSVFKQPPQWEVAQPQPPKVKKNKPVNLFGHGRFSDPYFKVLWEGVKPNLLTLFFIGASAIKSFVRSRIFRYGLPKDILSKGQKNKGGGGRTVPPPPIAWRVKCFEGV